MRQQSPVALLTLSIAGLAGYAVVARSVSRRRTANDRKLRNEIQKTREPEGDAMAEVVNPIGKEWLHIPVAALLGGYLSIQGAGKRAIVPLVASVTSDLASRVFDRLPPNRRPPPGHPDQEKPSFPSSHANETAAVAFTSAYVLARQGVVATAPAFAVATLLSIASPASRLYQDRHWVSDVIGGWCLGVSIASGCAAIYEATADED